MRKLQLSRTGFNKLKSHQKELKVTDIEDSIKSIPPGEWCIYSSPSSDEAWAGYINPNIQDKFACAQVLTPLPKGVSTFDPASFIQECITKAYHKRLRFKGYEQGSRLFYGASDGLTGLIIDHFKNASVIQINTAGIDRYRDLIQKTLSKITGVPAFLLDNAKYREKESLPSFENEPLPDLEIIENDVEYTLRSDIIQKVGFYYDHRENRIQLQQLLNRTSFKPEKGLDLFCYAGAWGLNALKAGVPWVEFVDQGNLQEEVMNALKQNGLVDRGEFHRNDVFKFLDEAISKNRKFDLILCDPPAFAKSAQQKAQALEGYSKLHRKVMRLASAEAICTFSSCTHYISHDEFQKNIIDAANREGRKIRLLYCGMQGWDHPVSSLDDKANYIKSYFYILE